MPMYVKSGDGRLIRISKAAEAGGSQTIGAVLEEQGYEPPEGGPEFTDAAAELLGPLKGEYDGPATGASGAVLKADAEAWLATRNEEE